MLIIIVIIIIHMIHLPTSCHPPLYWGYWTIDFSGKSPGGYSNWASLRFSGKLEVRTRRARQRQKGGPRAGHQSDGSGPEPEYSEKTQGHENHEWRSRHPGCGRPGYGLDVLLNGSFTFPVWVHLKGKFVKHINTQDCPELQTVPPIYPFAHVFLAAWDAVAITTDHLWCFLRSKGNVKWIMEEGKL